MRFERAFLRIHACFNGSSILAVALFTTTVLLVGCMRADDANRASTHDATIEGEQGEPGNPAPQMRLPVSAVQKSFDGERAYKYLQALCQLGSRCSGSPGMQRQQEILSEHFSDLGAAISFQEIDANLDRRTGRAVPMANMIITWHPESNERILLCAHYDTRPLPDQDRDPQLRRNGVFVGANDGASGVALLMEMAHHISDATDGMGVDFVFFDAEEYVFDDQRDDYFLGSRHFAQQYRRNPPSHNYVAGVLLDMVADARLSIYQEQHSVSWPDTRPIVKEIWSTAERLGVDEFKPRARYLVRDDHLPLHEIARIPVCDVIDFEYPDGSNRFWHTTSDAPENCSAESLEKVGRVILTWLDSRL